MGRNPHPNKVHGLRICRDEFRNPGDEFGEENKGAVILDMDKIH
jgi:hypothetical protein